jgi:ribosomal protein S12 methylthiotransferase accessory factor YcaO
MSLVSQSLKTSLSKIKHASLQHATAITLSSENMLSVPRSLILNGIVSYGGSTGAGLELTQKAFGEYYERNHFFNAVPITSEQLLSDIKPHTHQARLASLIKDEAREKIDQHRFAFTTVKNLFDHSPYDYFYNAISLHSKTADTPFLYVSDSCACASHVSKEQALYQSMIEFLERQSLIGSWVSKRYRYTINPAVLKNLSPYSSLVDKILENGDLYIIEHGNHLPAYNIVMFYFSHCSKDAVQYTVGAKTACSLADALTGAFEELYQCYTYLYNAVFKPTNLEHKAGAGYHMAFTDYNHPKTRDIIPFLKAMQAFTINTLDDVLAQPIFNFEQLLESLKTLTPHIYYYHTSEPALGLHFTKIISPDFFAHMSLNKPLNMNNAYAKQLHITPDNAYLEKLPFP